LVNQCVGLRSFIRRDDENGNNKENVMQKRAGEVFTVEREESSGTAYSYYPVKLDGGLALIESGTRYNGGRPTMPGGPVTRYFTFLCVKAGKASYQLAKLRVFDVSHAIYEDVENVEIIADNASEQNMPGGWSEPHPLTAEEKALFEEATAGLVGVSLQPLSVSIQIVAGKNYRFDCDAKITVPNAKPYKARVEIYQPLQGKPVLTNITRLP